MPPSGGISYLVESTDRLTPDISSILQRLRAARDLPTLNKCPPVRCGSCGFSGAGAEMQTSLFSSTPVSGHIPQRPRPTHFKMMWHRRIDPNTISGDHLRAHAVLCATIPSNPFPLYCFCNRSDWHCRCPTTPSLLPHPSMLMNHCSSRH